MTADDLESRGWRYLPELIGRNRDVGAWGFVHPLVTYQIEFLSEIALERTSTCSICGRIFRVFCRRPAVSAGNVSFFSHSAFLGGLAVSRRAVSADLEDRPPETRRERGKILVIHRGVYPRW